MAASESRRAESGGCEDLNAAFWDLGLRFQWDAATWHVLVELDSLEAQIAYYLAHWQPHLLAVYDPAFLAKLVESRLKAPSDKSTAMEAMSRA